MRGDQLSRQWQILRQLEESQKPGCFPFLERYVSERIWHENQKIRKLDDGSLELTFNVAGLDEIKQCILSLGPEAYVMEPEKLRKMIQSDLRKMIFQYEGVKVVGEGIGDGSRRTDYGGCR